MSREVKSVQEHVLLAVRRIWWPGRLAMPLALCSCLQPREAGPASLWAVGSSAPRLPRPPTGGGGRCRGTPLGWFSCLVPGVLMAPGSGGVLSVTLAQDSHFVHGHHFLCEELAFGGSSSLLAGFPPFSAADAVATPPWLGLPGRSKETRGCGGDSTAYHGGSGETRARGDLNIGRTAV